MAQRKPEENIKIEQVLKLVEQLSLEEREEVLYKLKLEDVRRELQKGIDSADRGELYTEEEVMKRLDARRQQVIERHKK